MDPEYEQKLDATISSLQAQLQLQQQELERLQSQVAASNTQLSAEESLAVMKKAYDNMFEEEPFLSDPSSLLPSILALHKTHHAIADSREYLENPDQSVERARQNLEMENAQLRDQEALSAALKARLEQLQTELGDSEKLSADDMAREKLAKLKQKKRDYDRDTARLLRALNSFVDSHLAPMLAAEELGGPVVGDLVDVDSQTLDEGFTSQGQAKRQKTGNHHVGTDQRRIDELWASASHHHRNTRRESSIDSSSSGRSDSVGPTTDIASARDKAAAAGEEIRSLTEKLLNQLMEAKGDNSASYVKIERETAAVRFLVRSKVAMFHPRDASKLRLVDFGRELDS